MWQLDQKEGWELKDRCFWNALLEKPLRVPWTARRSNQSILKEINPKYSSEGLMLKLKFQYFGHLMQRTDSSEETLILRKIEGKMRREWQRRKWLDSITDSMDMSLSKLWEMVKDREAWSTAVLGSQRLYTTEDWTTKFFNWRTIALQHFVGFYHTATWISHQFSSVAQSCPTPCNPMNLSTPGLPVHHQLPGFTAIGIHISPPVEPPPSHLPPHPTPLGCCRAPVWVPWVIQRIPSGCLFYIC